MQSFVKAKQRGSILMSKTRGLLPETVLLNILNCASVGCLKHLLLGGAKGSQPLDISFVKMHVLEKRRHRENAAAIAQADVEKFHDAVTKEFVLKALVSRQIHRVGSGCFACAQVS